ncbi:MAG: acyl-CoA thioesterase [Acholeplasmatales bacterium]|nr:acyl-CoA thioesterase [Acholeplasmatales bacterium]
MEYLRHVHYHETDQMGVVHHSNYVKWMEEARVEFLNKVGITYKEMEEKGIISPVVSINVNYKSPAHFDDDIIIKLWVKRYNGSKIEFSYEMKNKETDQIVCEAESLHCFIKDNKIITLRREYVNYHNEFMKYVS